MSEHINTTRPRSLKRLPSDFTRRESDVASIKTDIEDHIGKNVVDSEITVGVTEPEVSSSSPDPILSAAGKSIHYSSPSLKGKGFDSYRKKRTDELLEQLDQSSLFQRARIVGFNLVLGGLERDNIPKYSLDTKFLPDYDPSKHGGKRVNGNTTFSGTFARFKETGADVFGSHIERPFERFKFYFSFDLSTEEKRESARLFAKELFELACEKRISMATKTEDHHYDSLDLYTFEPREMADIIGLLYPKYPDIWLTCEHPLQGSLDGINPKHVGWVQEPVGGVNGSHSARMTMLGKIIDNHGGVVTPELWVTACESVGVRPDRPWLIDPRRAEAYYAKMKYRNERLKEQGKI